MPITRKQQLLAKLETTEGGGASFSASDAIQVFDPGISDAVDTLDRVPAGPTLSRDFTPIGRKTREITFTSDLRGSGVAATAPPWGDLLAACGYKKNDNSADVVVSSLTMTSDAGTPGVQLGEVVQQTSANRAVVVGIKDSSGNPKAFGGLNGDVIILATIEGTMADADTTGESSVFDALATTFTWALSTTHHAYMPTSEKLITLSVASWVTAAPVAGDTMTVHDSSGDLVGSVQVDSISGTDLDVVLLWGAVAQTDELGDTVNDGTIDAAPVMSRTPSLAFRHNLDGRNRLLLGARGTFSCEGEVGAPMSFSFTFTGDVGTDADAAPITTTGLGTVRAPRLLGAVCAYGEGANVRTLQTKSINFDNAGTVAPNLDANSAGGATGANITDRDSTLTVQVDNTNSTMDWEALRDAGTVVRAAFQLGTVGGNVVSVVLPNCQVTDVSIADAEGVSAMDVTLRPRRLLESGDDEVYFCQL